MLIETFWRKNFEQSFFEKLRNRIDENLNFQIGARELNFEIQKFQNSSFANMLKLPLEYEMNLFLA